MLEAFRPKTEPHNQPSRLYAGTTSGETMLAALALPALQDPNAVEMTVQVLDSEIEVLRTAAQQAGKEDARIEVLQTMKRLMQGPQGRVFLEPVIRYMGEVIRNNIRTVRDFARRLPDYLRQLDTTLSSAGMPPSVPPPSECGMTTNGDKWRRGRHPLWDAGAEHSKPSTSTN